METNIDVAYDLVQDFAKENGEKFYAGLTIEENDKSVFTAENGVKGQNYDMNYGGARVHMISFDQDQDKYAQAHEIYAITSNTSEKGLQNLMKYAKQALTTFGEKYDFVQTIFDADNHGVNFYFPTNVVPYKPKSDIKDTDMPEVEKPFDSVPKSEKIELVKEMSMAPMGKGISKASAFYVEHTQQTQFVNTNGAKIYHYTSRPHGLMMATAQKITDKSNVPKTSEIYSTYISGGEGAWEIVEKCMSRATIDDVGKDIAKTALEFLRAKPYNDELMPVVLSGKAGGLYVHEIANGHVAEADIAINDNWRVLMGKMGKQVAPEFYTSYDDGRLNIPGFEQARGSRKYDAHGTPSQHTVIVENGVFKNWLISDKEAAEMHHREIREAMEKHDVELFDGIILAPNKEFAEDMLKQQNKNQNGLYKTKVVLFKDIEQIMDGTRSYMEHVEGIENASDADVEKFLEEHFEKDTMFTVGIQKIMIKYSQTFIEEKGKEIEEILEKEGVRKEYSSTGNSISENVFLRPLQRMTNTAIEPIKDGPNVEELAAMTAKMGDGRAIYVKESAGGYVSNGMGHILATEAYLIEDGEIRYDKPLKNIDVSTHTLRGLKNIVAIGGEETFQPFPGTCGKNGQGAPNNCSGPAMLLDDLTVQSLAHGSVSQHTKTILEHEGVINAAYADVLSQGTTFEDVRLDKEGKYGIATREWAEEQFKKM